jgi:xanthine dehydrogenase accessory factor
MTHSHALDLEIVARALQRTDARFVGLIGSETKAAKFRSRLRQRGVDPSGLVSPIGLFKAGKHPAEVAVSAVAQILETLRSASSQLASASHHADPSRLSQR